MTGPAESGSGEHVGGVDVGAAEAWLRSIVPAAGPPELERERPWATVFRVPLRDGDRAWFKACRPVQRFEPALTAALATRWPDRVVRVLGHDPDRAWLLTADAGEELGRHGNDPSLWLRLLPGYAELQRGEAEHVGAHLRTGIPDRSADRLPSLFEALVADDLPIEPEEHERLRTFDQRFEALCAELDGAGTPPSIQHDDLHLRSVFVDGPNLRVLDWGDACIGHPFASLVVTFRFLEDHNGLATDDPWFDRLGDAYLEPWGSDRREELQLAMRVGMVAQMVAWQRHRAAIAAAERGWFDRHFAEQLRRTLARVVEPAS